MKKNKLLQWIVIAALVAIVVAYLRLGLSEYVSLEFLKSNREALLQRYQESPLQVIAIYMVIYIVSTALSLPGAAILTLAGGALFGLGLGTLIVSIASTTGATLAFLVSRFLLKDWVQAKFEAQLQSINRGIEKEGAFYLFSLRLVPAIPFFLINLTMGLTPIGTATFFVVSQVGMLPGTLAFVNAGTQLGQLSSIQGILSFEILAAFAALGILPLVLKWLLNSYRRDSNKRRYKKPKSYGYNMVVIGAGSAGLVSAYIAAAVKAKVALIEKHKMGGDCLNTGCVPSKALIRSAKAFHQVKHAAEFGVDVGSEPTLDFAKVMERVQSVIKEIEPHDSVERYTGLGVECISGEAKIVSPYEVQVNGRTLTTKNIVIATGASPLVPNLPGLENVKFLTSDNVWNLRELPKRLVVLGGGPIGCELAQSFARFGSQVSLLEMAPRLLAREDEDVSAVVTEIFLKEGVDVRTRHKALRIQVGDGFTKALVCELDGQEIEIPFDEILIALGRKANVRGFGLEDLGVEISHRGTLVADSQLRTTNYSNIFVCGDVTGPFQFTHTASHQAWYVAVNALFRPFARYHVDYRVIPWCTFTDPEVARVGLNEMDANAQGIPYQVSRYGLDDLDRAIAEGAEQGFVKVLTVPGSDKILGVTIVGHHAGDIIAEFVAAMKHGFGLDKILGTIHIYPTFAEANKFAAGVWRRQNAPQRALQFLARFHAWRRG